MTDSTPPMGAILGGILGGPIDGPKRLAAQYPLVDAPIGLSVVHRATRFAGVIVGFELDGVRYRAHVLSVGGPGTASDVPAKFIMDHLFGRANLALASAGAVVLLITVLALVAPLAYARSRQAAKGGHA